MLVGGVSCTTSCVFCGWKNISLHLSGLTEKLDSWSQENVQLAAIVSLAAVALKVSLEVKMLLLLT